VIKTAIELTERAGALDRKGKARNLLDRQVGHLMMLISG
jgi:hypothetical protein